MVGAASGGSLLARTRSGIAPRLPDVTPSNPPRPKNLRLPQPTRFSADQSLLTTREFLIAGEKILKTELTSSVPSPNVFLIAGVWATFSPATAPRISNRYTKLLEIELTHSQQTRKHFLIATICPTFFPAPLLTRHVALNTHRCLTSFLFATNEMHKIIAPLKTKEKPRSIRYKFALRATQHPILAASRAVFYTSPPLIANVLGRRTVQTRPSRARLSRCDPPDAMANPEFEKKKENACETLHASCSIRGGDVSTARVCDVRAKFRSITSFHIR